MIDAIVLVIWKAIFFSIDSSKRGQWTQKIQTQKKLVLHCMTNSQSWTMTHGHASNELERMEKNPIWWMTPNMFDVNAEIGTESFSN